MNIAEFFINIGIKGDSKTNKALKDTKSNLDDVKSTSLEAKAALIAILYGMEQIMSNAAQRGMELQQFGNLTGLSADKLQRWQYMARQSGESAEDMAGSIKNVQNAMTNMLLGKGAPEGLGVLAKTVGFDSSKARDTFYVMDKLREYARTAPPDMGNHILKSFGLSDDAIQTMRTSKVELDKIKPSQIYSSSEIAQLAKVQVAWANLWNTMKMFSGRLTAQFGMDGINILTNAFKLVSHTIQDIIKYMAKFPTLKAEWIAVGVAIAAVFAPITTAIAGIIYLLSELEKWMEGKGNIFTTIGNVAGGFFKSMGIDGQDNIIPDGKNSAHKELMGPGFDAISKTTSTTINQNLNFQHDGKDPIKLKDAAGKGVREAVAQMPSRVQVN